MRISYQCQWESYAQNTGRKKLHINTLTPADLNTLVSATQAAHIINPGDTTKTVNRIRDWKRRGILTPTGLDPQNRPLYRIIDILRVEQKMRNRR